MHCLLDSDILLYEASFVGTDKDTGIPHSFDYVESVFLNKVQEILSAVGATSYTLFLTGKGNFRNDIATVKKYKGSRVNEKPFHYNNLKAYMLSLPQTVLVEGMEADDALAIAQTKALANGEETVICSRDKDLRQVPGMQYGWEMGAQPEYPMRWVDEIGSLELILKHKEDGSIKSRSIKGTGSLFFYSQLVTGDTVDNIPGIPGMGAVQAFGALSECTTVYEMYKQVLDLYDKKYGEEAYERLLEQAYLLWMVRELDEEGRPVMWKPPEEDTDEGVAYKGV